ncbi:MAG: hypothetical protein AAB368_02055, partial [bacterium]
MLCVTLGALAAIAHGYMHEFRDQFLSMSNPSLGQPPFLAWTTDILAGRGYAPDQYRPLAYWCIGGLQALGLPPVGAPLVFRGVATAGGALALHAWLSRWLPAPAALTGLLALFAVLPLTYADYLVQPTDPLAFLAFCLGYLWLSERKDARVAALLPIAMLARESAILLVAAYAFLRFDELPRRTFLARLGGLALAGVAAYVGIRAHYGIRPYYTWLNWFAHNLTTWQCWVYPALVFGPWVWLASRAARPWPKPLRRAALMAPFFLLPHLVVASWQETRLLLPLLPILLVPALAAMFGAGGGDDPVLRTTSRVTPDVLSVVGADLQVRPPFLFVNPRRAYFILLALGALGVGVFYRINADIHHPPPT